MSRFAIVPERARVRIEARSSVHPITGEASGLAGYLQVGGADGRLNLAEPAEFHLEVPVGRLTSGNPLYDRELRRRLEIERYPLITGTARDVTEVAPGRYRVRGDLTVHGVTRTVEGELQLGFSGDGSLVVEGAQVFDIRQFGLEAPRLLMLKVDPEVLVRIRIEAAPGV
jgi:polyisoprenoid-binding protein YceI